MDRKEPYVGMPIVLGDFEEEVTAPTCCDAEIRPQPQPQPDTETSPQPPQQTMMVAMAYVPWQRWQQPYDYERGFQTGTIFPDLDLPFTGYQGGMNR
ncbi:MAG: spore coat associated protein CotJA [Anaerovoracaceae bacterium]